MSDWFEIAVATPAELADDVASLLVEALGDAAAGVEQRDREVVFWTRPERSEAALAATRAEVARLAADGMALDPAAVTARPAAPEAEWRDAWKRYFKVIHLTRQIVVVPSWEAYTPVAGDLVVHLDPGQAFGTGAHASTRLVLEELQHLADEGVRPARVLDVGTGSGILAIAAARLWPAAEVVATDEDPLAVATARENLDQNDLPTVATSTAPLGALAGRFDVVVANIQENVLAALAPELVARVAPGGALVLSGLLTPQAPGIGDRYAALGLIVEAIRLSAVDPEWSAVRLRA